MEHLKSMGLAGGGHPEIQNTVQRRETITTSLTVVCVSWGPSTTCLLLTSKKSQHSGGPGDKVQNENQPMIRD